MEQRERLKWKARKQQVWFDKPQLRMVGLYGKRVIASAHSRLKSLLKFQEDSCSHKKSLKWTGDRQKQTVSGGRVRANSVA